MLEITEVDLKNLYNNIKRLLLDKVHPEDQSKLDDLSTNLSSIINFYDTMDLCFLVESLVKNELQIYIFFYENEVTLISKITIKNFFEIIRKKIIHS